MRFEASERSPFHVSMSAGVVIAQVLCGQTCSWDLMDVASLTLLGDTLSIAPSPSSPLSPFMFLFLLFLQLYSHISRTGARNHRWGRMENMQYLSFQVWVTSLTMIFSTSIRLHNTGITGDKVSWLLELYLWQSQTHEGIFGIEFSTYQYIV